MSEPWGQARGRLTDHPSIRGTSGDDLFGIAVGRGNTNTGNGVIIVGQCIWSPMRYHGGATGAILPGDEHAQRHLSCVPPERAHGANATRILLRRLDGEKFVK